MLNQDMNRGGGGPEDESLAQVEVVPVDLHRQRFVGDDSQTLDVVLDYRATSADVGMVADHPGHAEEDALARPSAAARRPPDPVSNPVSGWGAIGRLPTKVQGSVLVTRRSGCCRSAYRQPARGAAFGWRRSVREDTREPQPGRRAGASISCPCDVAARLRRRLPRRYPIPAEKTNQRSSTRPMLTAWREPVRSESSTTPVALERVVRQARGRAQTRSSSPPGPRRAPALRRARRQ